MDNPLCDLECQRKKQLAILKSAMDAAAKQRTTNPEQYEQARIAYFTLLHGHGWLVKERERIAKESVGPTVTGYTTRYNALKGEQQAQRVFTNLADVLQGQRVSDEHDIRFLKTEIGQTKDRTSTLNRLAQLGSSSVPSWYSYIVDIVYVVLGLLIVYLVYTKFIRTKYVSVVNVSPSVT
jgi:hypothetical protein